MFFFFNDTATTEIYTLSLHDALPISSCTSRRDRRAGRPCCSSRSRGATRSFPASDRKSTRLNSSHSQISYAVFCLKKKSRRDQTRPAWDRCQLGVLILAVVIQRWYHC